MSSAGTRPRAALARTRAAVRRLPTPAYGIALLAVVNALVWSFILPPFQAPDENAHFAYAQHLAETAEPPSADAGPGASTELLQAQIALHAFEVAARFENRPIWSQLEDQAAENVLAQDLRRADGGGFSNATNNPPLYYALLAAPYQAASGGDLLDRLALMRLVSVLLAGVTALFTFLFLRELLPSTPWAATLGGLAVAFQPLFGAISGGINNDALLFAGSAGLLFALARAFRRGLTERRAVAIGLAFGIGVVGKATMLAFAPALVVAAVVLWRRAGRGPAVRPATAAGHAAAERRSGPRPLRPLGLAAGTAAVPIALYVAINGLIWDRPLWSGAAQFSAGTGGQLGADSSLREQVAYIWQFYLPRLPFMEDRFAGGYYPLWENWFKGFIGRFGWLEFGFPDWAYGVALALVAGVLALAATALWRSREALRARAGELATYVAAVLGLVVVIGVAGYGAQETGGGFEQARYLLPLLPLYGAIVALAARGAGRRAALPVAAGLLVLAMTHGLFAQLITIARYYG